MTDKERKLPDCGSCSVKQYCGTMVSSIRLCRSIHQQKEEQKQRTTNENEEGTEAV